MTVGLLIITHNHIGDALLTAATETLGFCPLLTEVMSFAGSEGAHLDAFREQASGLVSGLDQGDGVLVLTDIYGSTPSNIASHLANRRAVRVVCGLNLPMLLRVLNYAQLDLAALAEKAVTGGREGVVSYGEPRA